MEFKIHKLMLALGTQPTILDVVLMMEMASSLQLSVVLVAVGDLEV